MAAAFDETRALPREVDALLDHPGIWRGDAQARVAPGLATGHPALDALLPGGGWAQGSLTEVLLRRPGIGEISLFMPALARLSAAGEWIAFVAPPWLPYAPALAQAGIDLDRFLLVRAGCDADRMWAAEQALRSGSCAALLFWPPDPDERSLRRLQLAAEEGQVMCVLFGSAERATRVTPAALKLRLGADRAGLRVEVLKRRGGGPARPVLLPVEPGRYFSAAVA